ncbi:hypothetical protein QCA50_011563 [Cerrena zonata]|uniref:NADP-dependent oxidoreductase domain-containing protein n=1 Tax=Cerrena zonata TaxID=2478898 RepID=A0AAW0FVF9_9APHY
MGSLTLQSTVKLSSGHLMPLLGLGVYQNYSAKGAVLDALKAGYRHVDSAQVYRNEAHVGEAVKESDVPREEVFLTTKCVSKTHGYESTLKGVDESLQKLGTDYIDLFLIHDAYSGTELRLQTYKALLESRDMGKIRTVGVSNYNIHHIEEIKAAGYELPAVNQIELHPFCQQRPIVDYCNKNGIVVQAYSPLVRAQRMDNPVLQAISKKHSHEPAQILIRWSLQKGLVVLPKSEQTARINSNAQVYDFELDETDMQQLDALDQGKDGAVTWNPVDIP